MISGYRPTKEDGYGWLCWLDCSQENIIILLSPNLQTNNSHEETRKKGNKI